MNKRNKKQPITKKRCVSCGREKSVAFFYKVDSPLFPDGMLNTCRDCIRESIDPNNINDVIAFLRQIDKPFIKEYWEEALKSKNHPIGEYMRKINSLHQVKDKTFDDSDGLEGLGTANDFASAQMSDEVVTDSGEVIKFDESLINKWGLGYKKHEYLKLEKFYQDMMLSYVVETANHKQMLMQLAKLSLEMDNLLAQKDYNNYAKVSKAYDDLLKSAGFRPIDRKGTDEQRGLRSFSQIFEEVERRGFIKPPPPKFDEDVIDAVILALANYYHRLVGKEILTEVPPELKEGYKDYFDDENDEIETY